MRGSAFFAFRQLDAKGVSGVASRMPVNVPRIMDPVLECGC